MKKIATIFTSVLLCLTVLIVYPSQLVASAADNNGKKYISDVKVGMGETDVKACKSLLEEGYSILKDDQGKYFDLNKDAGSKSILKGGPNQKIVYLGYKTTDNAKDAITDLAVMNMDGGYSYQDYEKLMNDHMDTQIKPFVDRFIATLNEYRENLQKPQDSVNYKRANYYRNLLNKLTDDDTGNKPLGDLLVNKTKYELGDDAYNKLSDTEKKSHCDILTLLMQGNGQAVQLMETQLTKASDASDNTWLDRFRNTSLEKLTEEIKKENPNMMPSEINQELDKRYNDDAKRIRDKWGAFNEVLINYDNAVKKTDEADQESKDKKEIKLDDKSSEKQVEDAAVEMYKTQASLVKGSVAAEDVVAHDYLETTEYGDGTLLEFFERDRTEFDDEEIVRDLYPMVEALSGGQLAGLDFLSVKDMILMAVTEGNGFQKGNLDNLPSASIYQDVNREIYEKGGVALTDAALRAKANAQDAVPSFALSKVGIVLWCSTAAAGIAAAASVIAVKTDVVHKIQSLEAKVANLQESLDWYKEQRLERIVDEYDDMVYEKWNLEREIKDLKGSDEIYNGELKRFTLKSTICKYLTAGFTVAMAVLAGVSIYTTIKEMMDYYKVDFVPIPKYIVERTDITATNEKGETVMIQNQTAYYKAALCNRTDGSSSVEKKNHEILKDRNDLNGDVGMQWLSLYSVKYENGMPILADSLKAVLGGKQPDGYDTGIHRFGEEAAFNLTSKFYCYNDPNDGTYVYFKRDDKSVKEQTVAGSVFSGGALAVGTVVGIATGAAFVLLLNFSVRKRRENRAA